VVYKFYVHGWKNHPEILSLQKKYRDRKITQEDVDAVKAEMAADRLKKVVPVIRDLRESHVVSSPTKESGMTFWMDQQRFNGAAPILRGKKKP